VSVVIPTIGRPSLVAAVRSALAQSWEDIEVIVSIDGDHTLVDGLELPSDRRLRVIASGERVGCQAARAAGVAASSGAFVSLLDDDDVWLPNKVKTQMRLALAHLGSGARHVLVGCRMAWVRPGGHLVRVSPRRLPALGEPLAEYLFVRHQVRPDQTGIGAPMLLFDRGLAERVPLGESRAIHNDWNWVLEVDRSGEVTIDFCPEVLARCTQNRRGSLSSSASWSASLEWFTSQTKHLTPRQFADAVLCHSAPLAIKQNDWEAVGRLFVVALRRGRPGFPALAFIGLLCVRALLRMPISGVARRSET